MAKILLSEEVKRVQTEIRRLSTLLRRINEFKTTLKVEGADKEQNIAKFLQDNIDLLGSYSVDDVANNLDTNKSVIANLSIVAENVQSLIDREKNYASIDLTNVVVDVANMGKYLAVGAGGKITYAEPPAGGGGDSSYKDLTAYSLLQDIKDNIGTAVIVKLNTIFNIPVYMYVTQYDNGNFFFEGLYKDNEYGAGMINHGTSNLDRNWDDGITKDVLLRLASQNPLVNYQFANKQYVDSKLLPKGAN